MAEIKFLTQNFGQYDPSSIDSYLKIGGFEALRRAVSMDGEEIANLIASVKVKGRGGAGYDMGRKWSQARAVKGENKLVICNADEGESCTFKDRELIKNDPFNLLEGMIIGAWAIGAVDGFIYMREEYSHMRPILLHAIAQAKEKGFLGKNILGKGFDFEIKLYSGAGAYVCGEGTALIRSIEGKAGRPRMKPPFIKQSGAFARPTCLCNVESLSIVPHLLMDEKGLYASCGSDANLHFKPKRRGRLQCAGNRLCQVLLDLDFALLFRNPVRHVYPRDYLWACGRHPRRSCHSFDPVRRRVRQDCGP